MHLSLTPKSKKNLQQFNGIVTDTYLNKVFKSKHTKVDEDTITYIQESVDDSNFHKNLFLSRLFLYPQALQFSSLSLLDFAKAIRFVSYIWLECSKQQAYEEAFKKECAEIHKKYPNNAITLIRRRASSYEQSPTVTWLNKNTIENERALFVTDRIRAFRKLSDLMDNAKSEFIQMSSAKSLIEATQDPVKEANVTNVNVNNNVNNNNVNPMDIISAFKQANRQLAKQQQQAISNGTSVQEIAEGKLLPKRLTE